MGRRRIHNLALNLPTGVYPSGGNFYWNVPKQMQVKLAILGKKFAGKRWIPLGPDIDDARVMVAELQRTLARSTDAGSTIGDLCRTFLKHLESSGKFDSNTIKNKETLLEAHIIPMWGELSPQALTAVMLNNWRDEVKSPALAKERGSKARHSPGIINHVFALLRGAYVYGNSRGLVSGHYNPLMKGLLEREESGVRTRYMTDDEFVKLRAAAPAWIQLAMDVALYTSLRPSDIFAAKWSDITDNKLVIMPIKTRKTGKAVEYDLADPANAALKEVIDRARELRGNVHELRGKPLADKPILADWDVAPDEFIAKRKRVDRFAALAKKVGIKDVRLVDIRAKSATDLKNVQLASAQLLHTNQALTRKHYIRAGLMKDVRPMQVHTSKIQASGRAD